MKARTLVMIVSFFAIYAAITAYIGWNGWMLLSELTGWEAWPAYAVVVAFVALAYILGRFGQSSALRIIADPVKLIGSYWFALVQYGLLLLPIADLTALALKLAGAGRDVYLVGVGGVTALLLFFILVHGTRNAWSPVIRRYDVTIAKPARNRSKLTIAVASDLHLGTVIGHNHLNRLIAKVNEIKPDIILIPGDVLDDDLEPFLRKGLAATFSKLKAPLGVYAVTGNHEYIGRKVPEYVSEMETIGVHVLMDETAVVDDSFILIGRKDKAADGGGQGKRQSIAELVEPLDDSMPLILLDHQPLELNAAEESGIDLSLSGHTHRGQMMPNHLITKKVFELDWGYKRKGKLHAIVSSGFGFWGPPVRIGSRSEVLHVEVNFS
ncbi:metallophosphoesterase [Paenibacillus sp. LHD-117]|uniref:metallophosphoesterase n=1 Tax=Paenibacillus sp. LHD-117 TaxID=3071412 RepID=UPI0027E15CBC|nr:metallophosphoesterase [Paenibacillus sp. LHD-117]MDQ6419862.1 metallophosphoesterase [Paenibacillus sp. LHD-117]